MISIGTYLRVFQSTCAVTTILLRFWTLKYYLQLLPRVELYKALSPKACAFLGNQSGERTLQGLNNNLQTREAFPAT